MPEKKYIPILIGAGIAAILAIVAVSAKKPEGEYTVGISNINVIKI